MSDTTKATKQAKHTPGPWAVSDGAILSDRVNAYGNFWICGFGRGDEANTDEDQANARLIAAAPDLLRACRGLLLVAERMDADLTTKGRGYPMGNVPGFDGHQLFDAVRAILSAATGEG
jgi:hypothetical protein